MTLSSRTLKSNHFHPNQIVAMSATEQDIRLHLKKHSTTSIGDENAAGEVYESVSPELEKSILRKIDCRCVPVGHFHEYEI